MAVALRQGRGRTIGSRIASHSGAWNGERLPMFLQVPPACPRQSAWTAGGSGRPQARKHSFRSCQAKAVRHANCSLPPRPHNRSVMPLKRRRRRRWRRRPARPDRVRPLSIGQPARWRQRCSPARHAALAGRNDSRPARNTQPRPASPAWPPGAQSGGGAGVSFTIVLQPAGDPGPWLRPVRDTRQTRRFTRLRPGP